MTDDHGAEPLFVPLTAGEWGERIHRIRSTYRPAGREGAAGRFRSPHRPLNFDIIGLLVRHPNLAREFLRFNGFLLQRGELPLRLRELAVLPVAHTRRSAFFWGEHVKVAVDGGVPPHDIDRLARGNEGFAGEDLLVLEATDELLCDGQAGPATWQRLLGEMGTHRAMKLYS